MRTLPYLLARKLSTTAQRGTISSTTSTRPPRPGSSANRTAPSGSHSSMAAGPLALSVSWDLGNKSTVFNCHFIHLCFSYVFAAVFTTEDPCPTDNCSKYELNISINLIKKASWIPKKIAIDCTAMNCNTEIYDLFVSFVYLMSSIFCIKCVPAICINKSVKSHAISRFELMFISRLSSVSRTARTVCVAHFPPP